MRMFFATMLAAAAIQAAPARAGDRGEGAVAFNRRWLEPFFMTTPALRAAAEAFRLEDWGRAAEGFSSATAKLPRTSAEYLPARYMLALAYANLSLWPEAGAIFEDLWTRYPALAPYHAYNAARCRLRRGDVEGALRWADLVASKTVPEAESVLVKIEAFEAQSRWSDLESETGRFLERFPSGPRRPEAMLRRAEALEG